MQRNRIVRNFNVSPILNITMDRGSFSGSFSPVRVRTTGVFLNRGTAGTGTIHLFILIFSSIRSGGFIYPC